MALLIWAASMALMDLGRPFALGTNPWPSQPSRWLGYPGSSSYSVWNTIKYCIFDQKRGKKAGFVRWSWVNTISGRYRRNMLVYSFLDDYKKINSFQDVLTANHAFI